jgi:hypothetical protein
MRAIYALFVLLWVSACASTGMYSSPDGDGTALVRIENLIDSGDTQQAAGGWVTPGANTPTKVGLFTIDGDRLDTAGGDQQARVDAGKHRIQIFADGGTALRFKKFSLNAKAGAEYVVKVEKADAAQASYRAVVVDAAAPDDVITEVIF